MEKLKQFEGSIQTNNSASGAMLGGPQTSSQLHASTSQLNNLWDVKGIKISMHLLGFFFANGIAFNVCRSPYWKDMVRDLVNTAPKGYKPPSYEKMRTSVLSEERARIEARLHDIKYG